MSSEPVAPHRWTDDLQALLVGSLFVALSVMLLRQIHAIAGGTAGLAFIGHYLSQWTFGEVFFVLNLPFHALAWRLMGRVFVAKTFTAIALLSFLTDWLPGRIEVVVHAPHFAAVLAGLLAGAGMLMLVRHGASLGGVGVLALWLQERHGWRAGRVLLAADALILGGAYAFLTTGQWVDSLLAAAAMNLTLAVNHRPGRYVRG